MNILGEGLAADRATIAFVGGKTIESKVSTYDEPCYQPAHRAEVLAGGITKTSSIGGLARRDFPFQQVEPQPLLLDARRTWSAVQQPNICIGHWNLARATEARNPRAGQKADVFIACGVGSRPRSINARNFIAVSSPTLTAGVPLGSLAPENVGGSCVYKLDPVLVARVTDFRADKFNPGQQYNFGMRLGGSRPRLRRPFSVATIPVSSKGILSRSWQARASSDTHQVATGRQLGGRRAPSDRPPKAPSERVLTGRQKP
jgi:hypothetical protein